MLAINDKRVNKVKTNSACCANLVKNSGAVSPGGEKMKTVNRFCLYGMVLMGASVAVAEVDRSGLYLNLGVGLQDFDHKRDLDEDTTYLIGGEYRFGKHWATELRYYYTEVDYNKGGKVDVDQYGADGIYYFPMNDGAFEPYLAAGAGYGVFDDGDSDNDEMQLNAGGGLRIYMSERFSLRADVRAIYGEDDDTVDSLASVGVSFFFGAGGEIKQEDLIITSIIAVIFRCARLRAWTICGSRGLMLTQVTQQVTQVTRLREPRSRPLRARCMGDELRAIGVTS